MEWTPGITSKLASSGTMHIEAERLKTFDHRWPFNSSANLSPAAMAAAGLFFDPHPKTLDRAICFACKNALSNWDINDHPMEEHKRWYKSCAFVTGVSKNVPIVNSERVKVAAPAPSPATAPALSHTASATSDKLPHAVFALVNDVPKPPPLNSYLQSLGAPVTTDAAGEQTASLAAASDAEIVYSVHSSAPSPSRLLDDSFWSTPSLSAAGSDNSGKAVPSHNVPPKLVSATPKQSAFDDQEDGVVVQHNGRRLKKKPSARSVVVESSGADASQADLPAATAPAKLPATNGELSGHADAPAKAVAQPRIFNLASACAETASVRADFDAFRASVKGTLSAMQQQLPTFALAQLDTSFAQPLMKGLARLERASANIRMVQHNLSSRYAAQIQALKDISLEVERRNLDLNALERQIEDRREDVAKVHKFEETMRNAAVELSEKESRLADVQSRLGMLLERSRLAEERAASSELRLQCIQDKIDSKVKDNAAMEQRRKDNLENEATLLSREKDVSEQERSLKARWQKLFEKEGEVNRKDEENKVLESALESWQEKLSERESKLSLRTNYHGSDLTSGAMSFDH